MEQFYDDNESQENLSELEEVYEKKYLKQSYNNNYDLLEINRVEFNRKNDKTKGGIFIDLTFILISINIKNIIVQLFLNDIILQKGYILYFYPEKSGYKVTISIVSNENFEEIPTEIYHESVSQQQIITCFTIV